MARLHLLGAAIIVALAFLFSMLVSVLPASLLRLAKHPKAADRWMLKSGNALSHIIFWALRCKLEVSGKEKIPPSDEPLCFVANHQSILDIPAVVGALHILAGFIAKKELKRVPVLNSWINALHCVYIDRSSARSSVEAILQGVENIKNGMPMFIFPEGTRSKTGKLGEFKTGSLKLATRSKATIVPLAIAGTRQALEAKKGIKKILVKVSVGNPIPTKDLSEEELKELGQRVFSVINQQYLALCSESV